MRGCRESALRTEVSAAGSGAASKLIPFSATNGDGERNGSECLEHGHFLEGRGEHVGEVIGGGLSFSAAALHAGGDGSEVEIVGVVHHGVHALHASGCCVVFVCLGRVHVVLARTVVVAGALVDVSGHVYEMAGRGCKAAMRSA